MSQMMEPTPENHQRIVDAIRDMAEEMLGMTGDLPEEMLKVVKIANEMWGLEPPIPTTLDEFDEQDLEA